jgi:hypothetical protein
MQGHKAVDCQQGQVQVTAGANTTNTSRGKCYTCGKVGHYYLECYNKPRENVRLFAGMTKRLDNEACIGQIKSQIWHKDIFCGTIVYWYVLGTRPLQLGKQVLALVEIHKLIFGTIISLDLAM